MDNLSKIAKIAIVILIAVISVTKLSPWASDPGNHRHSIEQTDKKITDVMTLSAGAAGTSATLSLLPGDLCTPLAEQLAQLATYFMMILSALYLEKFLITLSGFITFSVLVPIACILVAIGVISNKKFLYGIAAKIALLSAVIYLIVPASVILSDKIYQTQADTIEETITEYNDLEIESESTGFLSELTSIASTTIDKVTKFISSLLESLAIMIVTACIVPLLVFVLLIWLTKTIFSQNVLSLDKKQIDDLIKKINGRTN
ncbi:MAG: hypothetical protein K6G06_01355 [Butyrivibrio sp.]|nr:hypothetical protein [Butyrivibrio sp.]